jgi:hypothetical protein
MESGMNNLSNKYSFWAFMEAIKIAKEFVSVVDKTHKWSWVKGHNYDVVVYK